MNDPQLAAALRSRSPDALPELLDAYGDQLFSYCWRLLRNRENAQIAVRDALVLATAQIGRLVCDERLGLWFYSLARAECLRREAVPASDADEPVALPNADDADSRLMAWKAVTSMPADEVDALELEEPRLPGSGGAAERLDRYHHPRLTSGATAAPSAAPRPAKPWRSLGPRGGRAARGRHRRPRIRAVRPRLRRRQPPCPPS